MLPPHAPDMGLSGAGFSHFVAELSTAPERKQKGSGGVAKSIAFILKRALWKFAGKGRLLNTVHPA